MRKGIPPTNLMDMLLWVTVEDAKDWQKKSCRDSYIIELAQIKPTARYCARWTRAIENKFKELLIEDGSYFDD